jgi:hypothetical protein
MAYLPPCRRAEEHAAVTARRLSGDYIPLNQLKPRSSQ